MPQGQDIPGIRETDWEKIDWLHDAFAPIEGESPTDIFLFGSGPSLNRIHPDIIRTIFSHYQTVACNYLFSWDRMPEGMSPTFWVASEEDHLMEIDRGTRQYGAAERYFFKNRMRPVVNDCPDWYRVPSNGSLLIRRGYCWGVDELDMERSPAAFAESSTILYAIQLAVWAGFRRIYLLGVDAEGLGHAYPHPNLPPDAIARRPDVQEAMQQRLITEVGTLHRLLKARGRDLYNATPGGRLTIPRVNLIDAMLRDPQVESGQGR